MSVAGAKGTQSFAARTAGRFSENRRERQPVVSSPHQMLSTDCAGRKVGKKRPHLRLHRRLYFSKSSVRRMCLNMRIWQSRRDTRPDWDKFNLWRYVSTVTEPTLRAYSMASYPEEKEIMLNVPGLTTPPPGASDDIPPRHYVFFYL